MPENASEKPGEVTVLLRAARQGDSEALTRVIPLVYDELRRLAAEQIRGLKGEASYRATALVEEAHRRLSAVPGKDGAGVEWEDRQHFLAVAASMMRRILVEHARERRERTGLTATESRLSDGVDLVALDAALQRLERGDRRLGTVVEMRFFGGMSFEDIAAQLEVDRATAERYWKAAKLVLFQALTPGGA